mmetsp:Transcript_52406/g.104970  ORF Transcript_52406/g.104970 Transcript_52406/m.104970 type:complete len:137 (+) Transcript_52406:444-854(+)
MRRTVGSDTSLPPLRLRALVEAFQALHSKNGRAQTLSVGARAWSKHAVRSRDQWWGEVRGSDADKNADAMQRLLRVLAAAVWANQHRLPDGQDVLEVRIEEGYGARWSGGHRGVPLLFRGFLEPMMEGGHEAGWRH